MQLILILTVLPCPCRQPQNYSSCLLPPSQFIPSPHVLAEGLSSFLPFWSLHLRTEQLQGAKLRRTSSSLPLPFFHPALTLLFPSHCPRFRRQMYARSLECSTSISARLSWELHQQKAACHESGELAVLRISLRSGTSRGAALRVRPLGQCFRLQITASSSSFATWPLPFKGWCMFLLEHPLTWKTVGERGEDIW